MADPKELLGAEDLMAWMNDAYAMELALAEVLENHLRDSDELPEHQERLRQHLLQTRGHAHRLRDCLEGMGGSVSDGKALLGDLFGRCRYVAPGMADDEIIRDLMSEYAAEHFEMACYRSLIVAAREVGVEPIACVCEAIFREEEEMARWVEGQIALATRSYLRQKAVGF